MGCPGAAAKGPKWLDGVNSLIKNSTKSLKQSVLNKKMAIK
jgi:hypothetical protein